MKNQAIGCLILLGAPVLLLSMCHAPTAAIDNRAAVTAEPHKPEAFADIAVASANCRAFASKRARIVSKIERPASVTIVSSNAGWSQVRRDGQTCWVSNALLSGTSAGAPGGARDSSEAEQSPAARLAAYR